MSPEYLVVLEGKKVLNKQNTPHAMVLVYQRDREDLAEVLTLMTPSASLSISVTTVAKGLAEYGHQLHGILHTFVIGAFSRWELRRK